MEAVIASQAQPSYDEEGNAVGYMYNGKYRPYPTQSEILRGLLMSFMGGGTASAARQAINPAPIARAAGKAIRKGTQRMVSGGKGGSMSHLSNEELRRTERFYRGGKGGNWSYQAKQPDAIGGLKSGQCVIAVRPDGTKRVVNSIDLGNDASVLSRFGQTVHKIWEAGGKPGSRGF